MGVLQERKRARRAVGIILALMFLHSPLSADAADDDTVEEVAELFQVATGRVEPKATKGTKKSAQGG